MNRITFIDDLGLEKFTKNDFENYYQLVSSEKVMEMITESAITYRKAKSNFEKIIQNNDLHPIFGTYKITTDATKDFIGLAKLTINNTDCNEAELGYMLLPEYWGKGIAGRVSKKLIEIAKSEKKINRIIAIIDPKNMPSRQILIKNEFISREFIDFDGLPGEILELKLNE
ncbi:MAG: GNAT family N-acetyltransferase [Prolixibacteraceae bacterium]|jgi:RimJ/RimL family protein N-acetyltransferase